MCYEPTRQGVEEPEQLLSLALVRFDRKLYQYDELEDYIDAYDERETNP